MQQAATMQIAIATKKPVTGPPRLSVVTPSTLITVYPSQTCMYAQHFGYTEYAWDNQYNCWADGAWPENAKPRIDSKMQ